MGEEQTRFFRLSPTGGATKRLEEAEEFYLRGNLNEALAAAQQAWREHPEEADVMRVLAYVHMSRGEYQPAATAAWQAVVKDGEDPASYATMAQVYLTFNMLPQAEEAVTVALRKFPQDPSLLVLAADLGFRQQRDMAAADLAAQALKLNPADGYAKALLGTHYLAKKRYAEAALLLADAVVVYPQRWDYLRDLGICRLHTGDYLGAREALARSFLLFPADARGKQHLLYALKMAGNGTPAYWRISFFFYNQGGLGWTMAIIGGLGALVCLIWGLIVISGSFDQVYEVINPILFFLAGVALVFLPGPGILMNGRRSARFDRYLSREVEGLSVSPAASS